MRNDKTLSLLLAEDDPEARELLEKLLRIKFSGLTVYVAADGEQGKFLFDRHRPELIVTDLMMPVTDGVEMSRWIRARKPDAYIIALTAYNDADYEVRNREIQFNHCIQKPVDLRSLVEAVGNAVALLLEKEGRRDSPSSL